MQNNKKVLWLGLAITVIVSSFCGAAASLAINNPQTKIKATPAVLADWTNANGQKVQVIDEETAVVQAVEKATPAVVSIIISKDLPQIQQQQVDPFSDPFFQQFFGNDFNQLQPQQQQSPSTPSAGSGQAQKTEVGGGSGFIVTADGYIVTNKHVVADDTADYTVLLNNGKKYPAKVLAKDPLNDLAVIKIDATNLPTLTLGDSANLKLGMTTIAIGNALGQFSNTVSKGIISGLSRSITAGDNYGLSSEQLDGLIQTDASINPGNSGGPLLNLQGQVIGVNVAMAQGAQNIGFALPVNQIKQTVNSVKKNGKLVRSFLGVRYVAITAAIAKANQLPYDYGDLIARGSTATDLAVIPGSPADKAGLVENDIILEADGKKLNSDNLLATLVAKKQPGDTINLKVYHKGETKNVAVKLGETQ